MRQAIFILTLFVLNCTISRISTDCSDDSFCFKDEICLSGTCVKKEPSPDVSGDTEVPDTATTPGKLAISGEALVDGEIWFQNAVIGGEPEQEKIDILWSGDSPVLNVIVQVEGDFSLTSNTCGTNISENCILKISFSPANRGEYTGRLTVSYQSNGIDLTVAVELKGVGLSPARLEATDVPDFSPIYSGHESGIAVTIKNTGDFEAGYVSSSFNGSLFSYNASEFPGGPSEGSCPTVIEKEVSCQIHLKFSASRPGNFADNLQITYTNGLGTDTLPISFKNYALGFYGNLGWGRDGFWQWNSSWFYKIEKPNYLAVDSTGHIFLSDSALHLVHKFSPGGQYVGWIGKGIEQGFQTTKVPANTGGNGNAWFREPSGIAVSPTGSLFIVDAKNQRIQKWASCAGTNTSCTYQGWVGGGNTAGFVMGYAPPAGAGNGSFNSPVGIAADTSGNIYITDSTNHRVQKWINCDGTGIQCQYLGWIGNGSDNFVQAHRSLPTGKSDRLFHTPKGIAIDSAGNLYITDSYKQSPNYYSRVQKWKGCNTSTLPGATSCTYVGWLGNGNQSGFNLGTTPMGGTGNASFWDPQGIAVDISGNLYITEGGEGFFMPDPILGYVSRVQKWLSCGGTSGPGLYSCTYMGWIGNGSDNYKMHPEIPFTGAGDRQFAMPKGVALDSGGNLYISDTENRRIQKWSFCSGPNSLCTYSGWLGGESSGIHTGIAPFNYGSRDRQFWEPSKMSIDANGNLWVADFNNHRIQKWTDCQGTGECKYEGWIGSGHNMGLHNGVAAFGSGDAFFHQPTGIAFDQSGNLFIADRLNNRVQKWASCAGNGACFYAGWIGNGTGGFHQGNADLAGGSTDYCFSWPNSIAMDDSGNLFVSDNLNHRIQRWKNCGNNGPCTIAEWIGGGHTAFSAGGTATAGYGIGMFMSPVGLAIDHYGNLFVADQGGQRIQKWSDCAGDGTCSFVGWVGKGQTTAFAYIGTSPSWGRGPGEFFNPSDIVLDETGNFLYIADSDNYRIQRWKNCIGTTPICEYDGWIGSGYQEWLIPDPISPDTSYYALDQQMIFPSYLYLDQNGYLYVSEAQYLNDPNILSNSRISKWKVSE